MSTENLNKQNQEKLSWFEKRYHALANLPGFLIYSGLCGLGIFFAVTTSASAPILFAAGCASALIFGLRAIAKFLRITKRNQAIYWAKKLNVLSSGLLGLILILFGALAFAGLLPGLSVLFNIGFVVSGVLFFANGVLNWMSGTRNKLFQSLMEPSDPEKHFSLDERKNFESNVRDRFKIVLNIVKVLLNIIGSAIGVYAALSSMHLLYLLGLILLIRCCFCMYASFCRTLLGNNQIYQNRKNKKDGKNEPKDQEEAKKIVRSTVGKRLEDISLGVIALALLVFGISLFGSPLFAPLGISILAAKIFSLGGGVLALLEMVANLMFGSRANMYDAQIEFIGGKSLQYAGENDKTVAKETGITIKIESEPKMDSHVFQKDEEL
ncbi:MAG: hypothetical protein IJU86_02605 [Firmicutes bacterium]|nr:hypothetical protein [Bacillota bacterium]